MIVCRHSPPQVPLRLAAPAPPPPPPLPTRGEVFSQSSSACARTLAQLGGVSNGGSLGYLAGSMLAGSLATSGNVALGLALLGAGVGGAVGWKAMGKVSDWAARLATRALPGHALHAEAAGRTALNLAVDLLSGSPITAAVDLSVTAGWGLYRSVRTPHRT
ncbi:hypothetical protein IV102_38020 [bacterium]|nr:hypothetical protein [bacterium]